MNQRKLKMMLVLEAFFGGIFLALTNGLLFVYLVSIGAGVEGISVVVGLSALTKLLIHLALYRYPQALLSKVKPKFVSQQALERLLFVAVPLTQDPLTIAVVYTLITVTPTSTYINLLIYSSFEEEDIRDVTAKRAAALGVANIIGFTLAIFLLAFLPPETKFLYTFSMGSAIGLVSTLLIALTDMRHLEGMPVPKGIEQPERLFATSAYFVAILAGGNLIAMVWVPYVMDYLKGPDYLAVAMNLVTTLTSVVASLFWENRSYRTLRYSSGLDVATPIMALLTPIPVVHLFLSAYSSFSYTGSNFVGSFLFAGYSRWLGALRSSIFIIVILCVAQLVISPVGILLGGDYLLIFLVVFGVKAAAFALASTTIPEVAMVQEQTARAYSFLLYNQSVTGYRVSVELSKETAILTLRFIGLTLILLTLYIIYRTLYLFIFP